MNQKTLCKTFLLFLLLATFVSCSSVKSRITEHEREFATYPPEVQAQIQNGRVDKGFTEDMVYLAKGAPSEKSSATREGKTITVWKYTRPGAPVQQGSTSNNLSTPYGYPSFGPGPSAPAPVYYDRVFSRVEFENGKVVRWDDDSH